MVTIMNNRTKSSAEELIAKAQEKAAQSGITPSAEQMAQMKAQISQTALLDGINHSFFIATMITVLALILAFFLKRVKIESAAASMDLKKPTK